MGGPTIERAGARVKVFLGETTEQTQQLLKDPEVELPDIIIASTFEDYKSILNFQRAPVDAVYLAVPNYMHVPMGLDAVKAGKHILMEKPLATSVEDAKKFLKIVSPFAPFMTEEIWHEVFGEKNSIHLEPWPNVDESILKTSVVTIPIQINGKVRHTIQINKDAEEKDVIQKALEHDQVKKFLGEEFRTAVYVFHSYPKHDAE